jgi:hypothetical protein
MGNIIRFPYAHLPKHHKSMDLFPIPIVYSSLGSHLNISTCPPPRIAERISLLYLFCLSREAHLNKLVLAALDIQDDPLHNLEQINL